MQMIQNKALRAICSLNWREHVTPCYILKIYDVAKLETAKFVHKFADQSLPKYFLTYFNTISAAHNYCTKSSSNDKFVILVAIVQTLRYDTILVCMADLFSYIFLCCGIQTPPFSGCVSFNFKRQHWPVSLTIDFSHWSD